MPKKFTIATYDKKHKENLAKRAKKVQQLYDAAVKRIAQAAAPLLFNADNQEKEFHFEDFPALKKEMEALMQDLGASLQTNIEDGDQESWTLSNTKNDAMADSIIGTKQLPAKTVKAWKHPHLEALGAFISRKEAGMKLSKRVWNLTQQFKGEMELALELGMGQGKSAAELSRDIRKYLQYPDKLFRRVRDKSGALRLSKSAAAFHPGRGVYRSSYKNALRMTATENNIAYRTADHNRWQALPFVLGIEVRLSNNHPTEDICDIFDGKRFPKDFKFTGWHPWCRCYAVSVLASQEEMDAYTTALMNGEDVSHWKFGGQVEDMPKEFTDWMKNNGQRMANAKSLPYFIRDNKEIIGYAMKQVEKTVEELSDTEQLAKSIGITIGNPMTHEQADMKHPNPHYTEGEEYRVNCQSCVVAYELRRRGYPVEAFGKTTGGMGEKLSYSTQSAWLDADGNIPTPIICKQEVKSRTIDRRGYVRRVYTTVDDVWKDIMSKTTDAGRYHLSWHWEGKDCGHIITMETLKDGTRRFYDPQTGLEAKNILPWIRRKNKVAFDLKKGIRAYRVDTLQPNPLIVKGVVKKAGTTGAAPAITAEQKAWWLENAQGATSFMGNGTYKDLNSWRKEIRKSSKLEVQEHSHSANLDTSYIRRSGQARINLIKHIRNEEELKAAEYIWDNPQSLRFVRHSPLGEVKDLSVEKDIKNIQNKKARFVTSYNVYEVDYNGITWEVKAEVYKNKAEQIYNIKKK